MNGLTKGRFVGYVLDGKQAAPESRGKTRPALVVEDWPDTDSGQNSKGMVNLIVFPDGTNDGFAPGELQWVTSRFYSETHEPGTWHWPPRVPTELPSNPAVPAETQGSKT